MGIFDGLLNMFGLILNSSNQRRANEQNVQMQRETNEFNREMARESMAWQQAENERAFNRNVEMWNLENSYNSPVSQMQRLKEAGLNPMMIYGKGAVGNTSSSAPNLRPADAVTPQAMAPHVKPFMTSPLFQGIDDSIRMFTLLKGQKDMQDAQINLIKAQELKTVAEAAASNWKLGYDKSVAPILKEYQQAMLGNLLKDGALKDFQISTFDLKRIEMELNNALKSENIKLNRAQQANVSAATSKLRIDNDFNSWLYDVQRVTGLDNKSIFGLGGVLNSIFDTTLGITRDEYFGSQFFKKNNSTLSRLYRFGKGIYNKIFN